MIVGVFPGDESGSGFYRLRAPAHALAAAGHDVRVLYDHDSYEMAYAVNADGTRRVLAMTMGAAEECDVVVFQRPTRDVTADVVRHLRKAGKRVVIDLDDNFDRLHPASNAARMFAAGPREAARHVHRAIAEADLTVCSTEHLAEHYGRWARAVEVRRNLVPADYLTLQLDKIEGSVGWSGAAATRHTDLAQLRSAFATMQRNGWLVVLIGRDDGVSRALGCQLDIATGWVSLDRYPHELGRLTVGAVPLADHDFNRSKSWLKGLEMASLGVPFVASPLPEYRELQRHGVGVLCGKPKHWARELAAVEGTDSRAQVRRAGLTYEDRVDEWWSTWTGQ